MYLNVSFCFLISKYFKLVLIYYFLIHYIIFRVIILKLCVLVGYIIHESYFRKINDIVKHYLLLKEDIGVIVQNSRVRNFENLLLLKNNENKAKKKSEWKFSELWKLTKWLQKSGKLLFKKNSWKSVKTVQFVGLYLALFPSLPSPALQ